MRKKKSETNGLSKPSTDTTTLSDRALKESEARFNSYFNLPLVGVAITSPEKRYLAVNDYTLNLLGYSYDEISALTWADLTHPDDLAANEELFNQVLAGETDQYSLEKRFIRKNGETIWTILSAACVRKPDRTVDYFVSLIQDITQRKEAEHAVQRERILLKTFFENIPALIYVKDAEGRKILANKADMAFMGCSSEEQFLGKTDIELFNNSQSKADYLLDLQVLKSGQSVVNQEAFYADIDGRPIWLLTTKVPLFDEEGKIFGLVGIGHDITTRKEAELQLAKLAAELKRTNATKDKLFSIIAHDLRGPLGSMTQGLEVLTGDENLEEGLRIKMLDELKRSAKATLMMLENLLNWSRSQSDSIKIEAKKYRLRESIDEMVGLLAPFAKQKSITVKVEAGQNIEVVADRNSINLILRNLLSNAIKFTPNNGLVSVQAWDLENAVQVVIADNGVGMKKSVLENLFKQHNFHTSYGTNREKGHGIGLELCKDFVERNGGAIQAESTEGKGSKFIFTIPKEL